MEGAELGLGDASGDDEAEADESTSAGDGEVATPATHPPRSATDTKPIASPVTVP
jgi:hypothetical protein